MSFCIAHAVSKDTDSYRKRKICFFFFCRIQECRMKIMSEVKRHEILGRKRFRSTSALMNPRYRTKTKKNSIIWFGIFLFVEEKNNVNKCLRLGYWNFKANFYSSWAQSGYQDNATRMSDEQQSIPYWRLVCHLFAVANCSNSLIVPLNFSKPILWHVHFRQAATMLHQEQIEQRTQKSGQTI